MSAGAVAISIAGAIGIAITCAPRDAKAQQAPVPYGQTPYAQPAPYGAPVYPPSQQPPYGAPPYGQPAYAPPPYAARVSEGDDSGRTLEFFYARAGAGGAMIASEAFSKGNVRFADATGFGGAFDVGVGLRLLVLTIGPRARALLLSNGTFFQVGGEAAFRIPMGRLDPFVGVEGGYTTGKHADASMSGGDVGVMGGLDYYVTPTLSVGGHASASLLLLSGTGVGAVLGAHVALNL